MSSTRVQTGRRPRGRYRRDYKVQAVVNGPEIDLLREAAAEAGLSVGSFVRSAALATIWHERARARGDAETVA